MKAKLYGAVLFTALLATCAITAFLTGCQGTKALNTAYYTTDAVGSAVDKAGQAFIQYEIARAKEHLGAQATRQAVEDWILADPDWLQYAALDSQFQVAYRAWCAVGAVASTGTNAATMLTDQFRDRAIDLGGKVIAFVAVFTTAEPIK